MHKPRPRPLIQESKRYTKPYNQVASRAARHQSHQLYVQAHTTAVSEPKLSYDQKLLVLEHTPSCAKTVPTYDKFIIETRLQYGSRASMIAYCDLLLGLYAGLRAVSTRNFSWRCDCSHTKVARLRFDVLDQERVEREREQYRIDDEQRRPAQIQYHEPFRIPISMGFDYQIFRNFARVDPVYVATVNRAHDNPMHQKQTVYDDSQNVHRSSVENSITRSINNLKTDIQPDCDSTLGQILHSNLSTETKQLLAQFCDDQTQHYIGLTYQQLLAYVWQRVQHPGSIDGVCEEDRRTELERILEESINNCIDRHGFKVCSTGRISHLVSTLDGFFPDIRINISDNERIAAIVLQTRDSLETYDAQTHIDIATSALLEAGFEHKQFKAWIDELKGADD